MPHSESQRPDPTNLFPICPSVCYLLRSKLLELNSVKNSRISWLLLIIQICATYCVLVKLQNPSKKQFFIFYVILYRFFFLYDSSTSFHTTPPVQFKFVLLMNIKISFKLKSKQTAMCGRRITICIAGEEIEIKVKYFSFRERKIRTKLSSSYVYSENETNKAGLRPTAQPD